MIARNLKKAFIEEKIAVHCKTLQEAKAFNFICCNSWKCIWLADPWHYSDAARYYWDYYKDATCYRCETNDISSRRLLSYSPLSYYKIRGYTIVEFSDMFITGLKGFTDLLNVTQYSSVTIYSYDDFNAIRDLLRALGYSVLVYNEFRNPRYKKEARFIEEVTVDNPLDIRFEIVDCNNIEIRPIYMPPIGEKYAAKIFHKHFILNKGDD